MGSTTSAIWGGVGRSNSPEVRHNENEPIRQIAANKARDVELHPRILADGTLPESGIPFPPTIAILDL